MQVGRILRLRPAPDREKLPSRHLVEDFVQHPRRAGSRCHDRTSCAPSASIGLDCTKGLPQKFAAFGPCWRGSRLSRQGYSNSDCPQPPRDGGSLHRHPQRASRALTGKINGLYGELHWMPIHGDPSVGAWKAAHQYSRYLINVRHQFLHTTARRHRTWLWRKCIAALDPGGSGRGGSCRVSARRRRAASMDALDRQSLRNLDEVAATPSSGTSMGRTRERRYVERLLAASLNKLERPPGPSTSSRLSRTGSKAITPDRTSKNSMRSINIDQSQPEAS